jgi:hypothetical protein
MSAVCFARVGCFCEPFGDMLMSLPLPKPERPDVPLDPAVAPPRGAGREAAQLLAAEGGLSLSGPETLGIVNRVTAAAAAKYVDLLKENNTTDARALAEKVNEVLRLDGRSGTFEDRVSRVYPAVVHPQSAPEGHPQLPAGLGTAALWPAGDPPQLPPGAFQPGSQPLLTDAPQPAPAAPASSATPALTDPRVFVQPALDSVVLTGIKAPYSIGGLSAQINNIGAPVDFSPFFHHGVPKAIGSKEGAWLFDVTAGRAFDGSAAFSNFGDELNNTPNAVQSTFMGNFKGTRYTFRAGAVDGAGSQDQFNFAYRIDTPDVRARGITLLDGTKQDPVITTGNQLLIKPWGGLDLRSLVSFNGDKTDLSGLLGFGQNYGRADGGGFNDLPDKKIFGGLGLHGALEYTDKRTQLYTQWMARLGWTAPRWQVEGNYTVRTPDAGRPTETLNLSAAFRLNQSTAQPARTAGPVEPDGPSVWGLNSTAPVAGLFLKGQANLTTGAYNANALAQYAWTEGNVTGSIGYDTLKGATWNLAGALRIINRGDKASDIMDPFLVMGVRGTSSPTESTAVPYGGLAVKFNRNTVGSLEAELGPDGRPAGFFRVRTIW